MDVHVDEEEAGVEGLRGLEQVLGLLVVELYHVGHAFLAELLAEAAGLAQGHAHDLVEAAAEGVDGVEVLLVAVLAGEVVPDLRELLVLLVAAEELALDLVAPDPVDLELLVLEAAAGLELLVAAHGVVHAVELHLAEPQLQRPLDHHVQLHRCLVGYRHALELVGQLQELQEGEALLVVEVEPAAQQRALDGPHLLPAQPLDLPPALLAQELLQPPVPLVQHCDHQRLV